MRYTAEISYYIDGVFHRQGLATMLIQHAIAVCPKLEIKNLIAMLVDRNEASIRLLEIFGFEKWGDFPNVVDFLGEECHHLYYGKRVWDTEENIIMKVYRFSPYIEMVINVNGYYPEGMRIWNSARQDGSQEFGWQAEVIIAADEYIAWANAASIEDYLTFRCDKTDFPLVHHTKLSRYWETMAE